MKKLVLTLGLSMTILLSAVSAQQRVHQTATPQKQESKTELKSVDGKKSPSIASALFGEERFRASANKSQVEIRQVACYKSAKNPDKATVKLMVYVERQDESGYQMLLDTTSGQYGVGFTTYYDFANGLDTAAYSAAKYKIPADAKPVRGTNCVKGTAENPGVDSVVVNPGSYDLLVPNPSTYQGKPSVFVAGGGMYSMQKFQAGMTYVYSVKAQWGQPDWVSMDEVPPFDVRLSDMKVEMPQANCGATEAEVSIELTNGGQSAIASCRVYYCLTDALAATTPGKADTVWEDVTIPTPLKYLDTYKYTFTHKIGFAKDTVYTVKVGVSPLPTETDTLDNVQSKTVARKSAVSVPYTFDFKKHDVVHDPYDWKFADKDGAVIFGNLSPFAKPAVTRCITMEAGKTYRLSYDHIVGYQPYYGNPINGSYNVLFGKADADITTWDTIRKVRNVFIKDFVPAHVSVNITEAGEYAFAFVEDATSVGMMAFRNMAMLSVLEKDAKIADLSFNMARRIPASQANGKFNGSVAVTNWGTANIDKVTVKVALGTTELFSQEVALGAAETVKKVPFEITTTGLKVGDKKDLVATVVLIGDENHANDSTAKFNIEVTDVEMAHDYVTKNMYTATYAIGGTAATRCGKPFYFSQKDTLTAISLGWADLTEDMEIGVAIHRWNPATGVLGDLIYQNTYSRGTDGGQHEYKVPAMLLEAGNYMISAAQLGTTPFRLITDRVKDGSSYVVSTDTAVLKTDLGNPAIRPIFGHDGKPKAKDATVTKITKPLKDLGLFTNEEIITVVVRNNGYEDAAVPVTVMVNTTVLPSKTVQVPAYGEATVDFKGDLSAPSTEYVLTAYTALTGDEDPSNDTLQRAVTSLPPVSPYVMDFEFCDDFAIGEEFIPSWRSEDISGAQYVVGIRNVSYPYVFQPVGFIAFPNGVANCNIAANRGSRCGANFAADIYPESIESNAWLISPKLKLPATGANMTFAVKSYASSDIEKYNVMVSTTDDETESFVKVGETREAPAEWTLVEVDLSAYNGQDVYVAIQHVTTDGFVFMIDDIVVGSVANEKNAASVRATVYPNPAREVVLFNAEEAIQQVSIFNVAGNTVYTSADHMNTPEFRYNVKGLTAGMYLARIKTAQGVAVLKFVVR